MIAKCDFVYSMCVVNSLLHVCCDGSCMSEAVMLASSVKETVILGVYKRDRQ